MPSPLESGLPNPHRKRDHSLGPEAELETTAPASSRSESASIGIVSGSVLAGRYRIERFLARGGMVDFSTGASATVAFYLLER